VNSHSRLHRRKSIRLHGYDYSNPGYYFLTICTYGLECIFGIVSNKMMALNNAGIIAHNCWIHIPDHFPIVKLHKFIIMPNHIHGIIQIQSDNQLHLEANDYSPQQFDDTDVSHYKNDPKSNNVGANDYSPLQFDDMIVSHYETDPKSNNVGANDYSPLQFDDTIVSHYETDPKSNNVGANDYSPLPPPDGAIKKSKIRSPSKTVGSIVRGYKIGVIKSLRRINSDNFPQHRQIWQRNYYDHIIRNEKEYFAIRTYIITNPAKWLE